MNYDEFIKEVDQFSNDEAVARLRKYLVEWKQDDTNVIQLADSIEHFFGNSWIGSEKIHNHLYCLWLNFKTEAITGIGGISMNERLYWFGLFERFDSVQTETAQKVVYAKVCANT